MLDESIVVRGVPVHLVFQEYHHDVPQRRGGELLSRPDGVESIEQFFRDLTYREHLQVLEWQLAWKDELVRIDDICASVNVHNSIVATETQRMQFLHLLRQYPGTGVIEFTETYPMPDAMDANRLMRDLREMGHKTALDDFGTELSGTSLVNDIDFEIIKVDRSLVLGARDVAFEPAMRLMSKLLEVLGRHGVVEGVEDRSTYAFMRGMGFTTFQGYLFHRPEPIGQFLSHALDRGAATVVEAR
jgi:EAL domain-containing protein (putative c-di-GMP-specific phosphodiesterase class I)